MPPCDELPEIEDGVIELVDDDDGPALPGPGLGPGPVEEAGAPPSRGCVFGSTPARLGPTASAHAWEFRRESKSALMPCWS